MKKEYINYRIIADKELLEFLRSEEEDRFSKMDALCDLLDKAAGENRESLTYFGTAVTLRKGQVRHDRQQPCPAMEMAPCHDTQFPRCVGRLRHGEDRCPQEVFPDNNELHVAGNGRLAASYDVTGRRTYQQVDMWLFMSGGNGRIGCTVHHNHRAYSIHAGDR